MKGGIKMVVSDSSVTQTGGQNRHLPFVVEARDETADIPLDELLDWLTDNSTWREEELHRAGALLFRGFSAIRTAEDFAAVAQRMAPEILDYAGGTTPRSAVTGKIVTSTDAPRHVVIGLHQEMSYLAPSAAFPDPTPDKVMFFCETAPGGGGQTPIADMRAVYRKLPRELVDRFESRGGLVLHRKLPTEKKYGFEVTWSTAFGTSDRGEMEKTRAAERLAREVGGRWRTRNHAWPISRHAQASSYGREGMVQSGAFAAQVGGAVDVRLAGVEPF